MPRRILGPLRLGTTGQRLNEFSIEGWGDLPFATSPRDKPDCMKRLPTDDVRRIAEIAFGLTDASVLHWLERSYATI